MKLLMLLWITITSAVAGPMDETRYCGPPKRYANGDIVRSKAVLNSFARIHPCPSTLLPTTTCPGWSINHTIPLACGGCDAVSNMQWLPLDIKSCPASAGHHCVDRFERKINSTTPPIPDTNNCMNEVTP